MEFYNYSYDLIAILLSTILIFVFTFRHAYITRTSRIFFALLYSNLILAIAELLTCLTVPSQEISVALKYIFVIPCLIAYNCISVSFFYYVLSVTKAENVSKEERLIGTAILVVTSALILTTPFTHLIVDLSVPGTVMTGSGYLIIYGLAAFLLIYNVVLLLRYHRFLRRLQIMAISGGIVLMLAASLIQLFNPHQLVISACASVMLVLIYAALEDPSEYMYKDSECFNDRAFYREVSERIKLHSSERIILFRIEGYEYISHMFDDKLIHQFRDEVIRFFHSVYGKSATFCLDNDVYAVIVRDERGEAAESAVSQFPGVFRIDEIEFSSSLRATALDLSGFVTTSDARHVVETVIDQRREGDAQRISELTRETLENRDREVRILQNVRHALKNDGFEVYYQPILEEKTGRFASAEALIRLRDTLGGSNEFISPAVFIPLAEQNGLIIPIGEYVFETVCRFYTANHLDRLGVEYIEVNLSPVQCMQQDLTLRMQAIMHKYGIGPEHINLEITETAESRDKYVMQRNIKSLLNRGMSFSLDDFGTGFSNIDHLAKLPVSLVKFDKSLLDNAMADENSRIILNSLMQMLKGLKYKCVAEGIETREMHEMVRGMGCDYYQGYLFSKPIPGSEYVQFLKQN